MKIAMIAPSEIPARRANTLQVMKMAQALCETGHQVTLIAPANPGSPALREGEQPTWEELAHHYGLTREFPIEWLPARPAFKRYDFSFQAVRRAVALHTGLIYTRLPQAAAIASRLDIPTMLEIHDYPQGQMGPWLFRWFLHGRGAKRLVIITRALADDLEKNFGTKLHPPFTVIAPDGVDLSRYQNFPSTHEARRTISAAAGIEKSPAWVIERLFHLEPDRFTAGYTGHLYPGRGSEILVELATCLPEFAFIIVGGEPADVLRLQTAVESRKLSNLALTGFVPNAELPLYQAACDVLLMPYQEQVSASSGGDIARYLSPMKLFEYLACQRAILSSNLPVLREALNEQNAILLPPGNIDLWAKSLRMLQRDGNLRSRLAAQASQDASQYTWQTRAFRIMEGIM